MYMNIHIHSNTNRIKNKNINSMVDIKRNAHTKKENTYIKLCKTYVSP